MKVTNGKTVKTRQITSGVRSRCGRTRPQRRTGFTLVELLVVIAIIALLMGILMPALNIAQKKAMFAVCKSGLHQIGLATLMYAEENRYRLPTGCYFNYPIANHGDTNGNGKAHESTDDGFVAMQVQPYLGSTKVTATDFSIFICPADKKTRESPAIFDSPTGDFPNPPNLQGSSTEEWYKNGYLNYYGPLNGYSYYIYYYYFGNYPFELTRSKPSFDEGELFYPWEITERNKGLVYPKNSTGLRAKLMQDTFTQEQMDYFGLISSHESYNPSGLFTDGSVEGLAKSSLKEYIRPAGVIIMHYW